MCRLCFYLGALTLLPLPVRAQSDLSRSAGSHRLLLIFAPRSSDPRRLRQQKLLARSGPAFAERDLLRFEVFPSARNAALRARYRVKPGGFRVLLIGKDGHVASSSSAPVSLEELKAQVDRMPMRREEMRRKGER